MEEHVIIGEGSEYPLDGLLTLPNKEGKFPVVILIHGSGATDMDETIYVNKPFLDIAKYLAAHDIATLRYNKRAYQYKKK